ncbi:MAG: discoidin domain-containing protein [Verrucomicrobia bacterium]|nr:discoidin domain-containing protein [Verrucomicrobiota bacterium]
MQNLLTASVLSAALVLTTTSAQAADADLAPLPLKLPLPTLKGTPDDLPKGPNIEPPTEKPRPPFLAPKGTRNLALNKKVTASVKSPFNGDLSQITDGTKEAFDDQAVELRSGVQWVQLDLGEVCDIHALVVWHDHRWLQVFRSVVVLTADDPDFVENVKILFNNDAENAAGLGIGTDKQYFETQQGRLISAPSGLKTRYLRFYTKGSNLSGLNCYQEIEVYGLPAAK